MSAKRYRHVYGPVASRRLGRSLGLDVVPFKTCSYDCIYCQCGATTHITLERKEYVPLDDVLAEVDAKLAEGANPDVITLAGSGEPTLYSRLGELIDGVKQRSSAPIVVLTNGSLLWDPEVRDALMAADRVIPSLDANGPDMFAYVNRPHPDLSFDRMIEGIVEFRKRYRGEFWLEVFVLGGVSAMDVEVVKMRDLIRRISPDRVQLNTVRRPPTEEYAFTVDNRQMERIAQTLGAEVEVIGDFQDANPTKALSVSEQDVLALVLRRPCNRDDIARGLAIEPDEAAKCVEQLLKLRLVTPISRPDGIYYAGAREDESDAHRCHCDNQSKSKA